MRRVFLDTETTGLNPERGDRIIEIAAIAYENRTPIDRDAGGHFHVYLNPDREVGDSVNIHGIKDDFLTDKPRFAEVADDFINFVRDAEVIIHNAQFDIGFLDSELKRINRPSMQGAVDKVICSLEMFRKRTNSSRNSLNAMCQYYNVDYSERTIHSAQLDTELLAQAYFCMLPQQTDIFAGERAAVASERPSGQAVKTIAPTAEELAAHNAMVAAMLSAHKDAEEKDNAKGKTHPPIFLSDAFATVATASPAPTSPTAPAES